MFRSAIVQNVDVYEVQRRINNNLKHLHQLHQTFPRILTVCIKLHAHMPTRHTARPEGDVATEQMTPEVPSLRSKRQHTPRSPACASPPDTRLYFHPLEHRSRCEQNRQNWPKHWVDLREHQQHAQPVQVLPHGRLFLILHQPPVLNRSGHRQSKRSCQLQVPLPQR